MIYGLLRPLFQVLSWGCQVKGPYRVPDPIVRQVFGSGMRFLYYYSVVNALYHQVYGTADQDVSGPCLLFYVFTRVSSHLAVYFRRVIYRLGDLQGKVFRSQYVCPVWISRSGHALQLVSHSGVATRVKGVFDGGFYVFAGPLCRLVIRPTTFFGRLVQGFPIGRHGGQAGSVFFRTGGRVAVRLRDFLISLPNSLQGGPQPTSKGSVIFGTGRARRYGVFPMPVRVVTTGLYNLIFVCSTQTYGLVPSVFSPTVFYINSFCLVNATYRPPSGVF